MQNCIFTAENCRSLEIGEVISVRKNTKEVILKVLNPADTFKGCLAQVYGIALYIRCDAAWCFP